MTWQIPKVPKYFGATYKATVRAGKGGLMRAFTMQVSDKHGERVGLPKMVYGPSIAGACEQAVLALKEYCSKEIRKDADLYEASRKKR